MHTLDWINHVTLELLYIFESSDWNVYIVYDIHHCAITNFVSRHIFDNISNMLPVKDDVFLDNMST